MILQIQYLLLLCLLHCYDGFNFGIRQLSSRSFIPHAAEKGIDGFERWCNPDFSKQELNEWFCALDKSLLTVGMKGVTESHINSLSELLQSHNRVRVKIASDRMNITDIADQFVSSPRLSTTSVLLEIRQREFMVGRT